MFIGTPEIYFAKRIDNSRVAKVADPKRRREMISFGITLSVLFLFVMVYLWQHFSAIEYGYRIEQLTAQRNTIVRIEPRVEPGRGVVEGPGANRQAGQTDGYAAAGRAGNCSPWISAIADPSTPVMAQANGITVVSALP